LEAKFLLWIHSHAHPALDVLFRISHEMGTLGFGTALVVIPILVALLLKKPNEALLWAALGISTYLLQAGLKVAIARPRPELWIGPIALSSYAFPSGHALSAATFYPLLAWAAATRWPERKRIAYAIGVTVAFYVGFGRLYLGVHWPSDVIAGWTIGAAQTCLGVWLLGRYGGATKTSSS
jgi:undecaprenyl-diphosphatase